MTTDSSTSPVSDPGSSPEAERQRGLTQGGLALAAAIVLGLAAVFTAWSAYRDSITSDLILKSYSEQQATISLANDTFGRADQQESLEVSLFLEWAVASSLENPEPAEYLVEVMGPDLYAAVDWWSMDAGQITPFVPENPYYANLPSQILVAEGAALLDEANALRAVAEEADASGDRYGLANVFFAVVLFIAGLTTIVQRRSIQVAFLALSAMGLLVGVGVLVTTPGWASLD